MGTIVTAAILIAVIALIIAGLVRDKRSGKSSCGCGCTGCAMKGQCHSKKDE